MASSVLFAAAALPSVLVGALVIALVGFKCHPLLLAGLRSLVSRIVNAILLYQYPIKHTEQPSRLPSLPYVFPNGQGNVEKFMHGRANSAKWEAEYGSLYRLWSGTKSEVVLTKSEHVEIVFRDSHAHRKADAIDSGYLMHSLLGSCLGLISGETWGTVMKCVETPFLHAAMSASAVDVQVFTRAYMRSLAKDVDEFRRFGKLHPVRDLKLLPFLLVAKVIYGLLPSSLEQELIDLIPPRETLFKSVIGGGITRFGLSRFLPLPEIRALHEFKDRFADWSSRAHAHALCHPGLCGTTAPVITMYEALEQGKVTKEQLLQTLDEMLFANIDVTMGGLSWLLVFLAAHPASQQTLRDEIRTQSATPSACHDYLVPSRTVVPDLLGACILESARLRPFAAFSIPQACPTPRVLDGFEIPAGTNYIVDSYALNVRDPFWGPDRENFNPERWQERHARGHDLRYRYWRFGFGPRTCLGKNLTDLILRSVAVEMLSNWHISLQDTSEVGGKMREQGTDGIVKENVELPWDHESWIHQPDSLLVCRPLTNEGEGLSRIGLDEPAIQGLRILRLDNMSAT